MCCWRRTSIYGSCSLSAADPPAQSLPKIAKAGFSNLKAKTCRWPQTHCESAIPNLPETKIKHLQKGAAVRPEDVASGSFLAASLCVSTDSRQLPRPAWIWTLIKTTAATKQSCLGASRRLYLSAQLQAKHKRLLHTPRKMQHPAEYVALTPTNEDAIPCSICYVRSTLGVNPWRGKKEHVLHTCKRGP